MAAAPDHHFFSDFARKQVTDKNGRPAGTIHEIAVDPKEPYPRATLLVLRRGLLRRGYAAVPWERIEAILVTIQLDLSLEELEYADRPPAFEFAVVRDILDQQVVDTNGQKVIRVNDLRLLQIGREVRLSHVDVGIRGIVRRLGWQWWADPFAETFLSRTDYLKDNLIDWRYVQPLAINPQKGTLKLTVDQRQLALIPHPELTDMLQSMDVRQRLALFESIAPEFRPRVFADLDPPRQKELLESMDLKEAAELLAKIPADQTTDLLEEMPKSVADSVLAHMETPQARRLSALLGYTSDSAGGLMTTEILTIQHTATAAQALELVRGVPDELDSVYHVFLVDGDNRLMGQVLIKRLLLAAPSDPLSRYAYPKPIYVRAADSLREVAFVMEKYKLPAIPVVNNGRERVLQGVITVDDILTRIIPLAWRRRRQSTP